MLGHNACCHALQKADNVSAQTPHTSCQPQWQRADDLGLFCSHRTWTPCSHWVIHELLCIPKYSLVTCEDICLTAEADPISYHATGEWPQSQPEHLKQDGWNTKESKCYNGSVKVQILTWWKLRNLNTNLNELKLFSPHFKAWYGQDDFCPNT